METFHINSFEIKRILKHSELKRFLCDNEKEYCGEYIIAYGAYHNSELVQSIVFGKSRNDKNYHWEILINCIKNNYIVENGTKMIWEHFINENIVRSCICYSYPDKNGCCTNEYINNCNFTNLSKSKHFKEIYFEGVWNGEIKRIDESSLKQKEVSILLNSDLIISEPNEQTLLNLGFEKKIEDKISPQIDSYFSGGIVYKITDLNTNKFYIGETFQIDDFNNGDYNGSGGNWRKYYKKYENEHTFKREILKDDFKTPKELYDYEVNEIKKYCIKLDNGNYQVDKSTGCMNEKTTLQKSLPICPECGALLFVHKKSCSRYKERNKCPECGGLRIHFKTCSQYKRKMCPECGVVGTHNKTCSHYKEPESCPECGKQRGHKKICSHYIQPEPCPECGRTYGPHKKDCSYYVSNCTCEFCGTTNGHHKTTCPNFDESFICEECGAAYAHKSTCSHYVERDNCCEFCGTPPGGRHKKECPNFKPDPNACPYCGTPSGGRHKKECPNFKPIICKECGGRSGRHKLGCSKYKPVICSECGGKSNQHKSTCSKYRVSTVVCPKCGGKKNSHKKSCPDYKGRWKDHK